MSDQYLAEKLRVGLKMVCWERNNSAKRRKLFAGALKHIADAGSIEDPDVVHVLDEYAREFRKLKLFEEGQTLEDLASKTRKSMPENFAPTGRELDWWEQPHFVNSLPRLPVDFFSSGAGQGIGGGPGGFLFIYFLVWVTLGIPYATMFQPILKKLDGMGELFFMFCIAPGITFALYKWRDSRLAARGHGSSCHVSREGIRFREPGREVQVLWQDMKEVWMTIDPHPDDDDSYDVVEVKGRDNQKFRMSEQFFSKQEVKTVYGLCKLKERELGKA